MATKTTKTTKTNIHEIVIVSLNVVDYDNNRMMKRFIRKNGIATQSNTNNSQMVFIGAREHIENMINWFFNNASLLERVNAIAC